MTRPVLAVDLGGTKILATLVDGAQVVARATAPTRRDGGPEEWLNQISELVCDWYGKWGSVGITVTGLIDHNNQWRALSRDTLDMDGAFPLGTRASALFGTTATLANDAHAAAWGEYSHGAGIGTNDMIFLTISTGIGGGIIANGRLVTGRNGMAGHAGLLQPLPDGGETPFENTASGRWIATTTAHPDARTAFADPAAAGAITTSARRVARLCQNLQLLHDPEKIVIGGGVGLAAGYLDRVRAALADLPDLYRPAIVPAALGIDAGVIGIAALATERLQQRG